MTNLTMELGEVRGQLASSRAAEAEAREKLQLLEVAVSQRTGGGVASGGRPQAQYTSVRCVEEVPGEPLYRSTPVSSRSCSPDRLGEQARPSGLRVEQVSIGPPLSLKEELEKERAEELEKERAEELETERSLLQERVVEQQMQVTRLEAALQLVQETAAAPCPATPGHAADLAELCSVQEKLQGQLSVARAAQLAAQQTKLPLLAQRCQELEVAGGRLEEGRLADSTQEGRLEGKQGKGSVELVSNGPPLSLQENLEPLRKPQELENLVCEACGQGFSRLDSLKRHQEFPERCDRALKRTVDDLSCPRCFQKFTLRRSWRKHLDTSLDCSEKRRRRDLMGAPAISLPEANVEAVATTSTPPLADTLLPPGYNDSGFKDGGFDSGLNDGGFNDGRFNDGSFNDGGFNEGGFNEDGSLELTSAIASTPHQAGPLLPSGTPAGHGGDHDYAMAASSAPPARQTPGPTQPSQVIWPEFTLHNAHSKMQINFCPYCGEKGVVLTSHLNTCRVAPSPSGPVMPGTAAATRDETREEEDPRGGGSATGTNSTKVKVPAIIGLSFITLDALGFILSIQLCGTVSPIPLSTGLHQCIVSQKVNALSLPLVRSTIAYTLLPPDTVRALPGPGGPPGGPPRDLPPAAPGP